MISYITTMRGIVVSRRPSEIKAEIIEECSTALLEAFKSPWYAGVRRIEAFDRLRSRIAELTVDPADAV